MTETVCKKRKSFATEAAIFLPAVFLVAILCSGLLLLFQYSFSSYIPGSLEVGGFTVSNYSRINDSLYLGSVWETLIICFWVTAVTLVLSYPLAYVVVRSPSPLVRSTILVLTILPFFLGVVVRSYAWMLVLGNNGFLNRLLISLSIIETPLQLIYRRTGVILALIQISLPIMVIMIATGLSHIDRRFERTALTLGASPLKAFYHVTWPLSLPGVIAGCIVVFGWTLSAFATPLMLGGGRVYVMTVMIYDQILGSGNYPFGAALGVFVLLIDLMLLGLGQVLTGLIQGRMGVEH
jgi:putative spermidine/putrescine transport system permease protein